MKPNSALKSARLDAGLTQEDLADLLGVSVVTVYRWERGEYCPGSYVRGRLSKLFRVSEQVLGFAGEPEAPASSERSSLLVDPALPASPVGATLGQHALLKALSASSHRIVGLLGLPGSGKSAIAQATAHLPDLHQQVDGLLWASVGQQPRPLRHLQRWLALLENEGMVPSHLEEAQDRLRVLLREHRMMLVLDDLWRAEDMVPYQLGSSCRYVLTTRLPVVAHTVCEEIFSPRPLTDPQAFHLLNRGLPLALAREHREILRALCQQVGSLPLAVAQIGSYVRRETRMASSRRLQEALTSLFQPTAYLHLHQLSDASSLADAIKRSENWLSSSARQAFFALAAGLPAAPASFAERQVTEQIQETRPLHLRDFDHLVDTGLIQSIAHNRYQIHPVIAAYARLGAAAAAGTTA